MNLWHVHQLLWYIMIAACNLAASCRNQVAVRSAGGLVSVKLFFVYITNY